MHRRATPGLARWRCDLCGSVLLGLLALATPARGEPGGAGDARSAEDRETPPVAASRIGTPSVDIWLPAQPRIPATPVVADPPSRRFWHAKDGGPTNVLVPVLEVPAINIAHWGLLKLLNKPYADINLSTIWENISTGHWIWDDDNYIANGLGHPYQGSWAFSAARSSGLDFWTSIPFPLVSSAIWELFMESNDPSINDMIMTPIGGVVVGETLHRLALLILDEGAPTFLRWLSATLVEPMSGINFFFFGRKEHDFQAHPPYFARMVGGGGGSLAYFTEKAGVHETQSAVVQGLLGAEIVTGLPGDDRWTLAKPFDHLVASGRVGLSSEFNVAFHLRGLVAGARFGDDGLRGLGGVYAGYDYTNLGTLRVATVSVGFGAAAQVQATPTVAILPTLVFSAIPFGMGGGLEVKQDQRDYHYGPGAQGLLSLHVVREGVGRIGFDGRLYFLSGAFREEGWEFIRSYTLSGEVAFTRRLGMGAEVLLDSRNAAFPSGSEEFERLAMVSVYWTYRTDDTFGAFVRARTPPPAQGPVPNDFRP